MSDGRVYLDSLNSNSTNYKVKVKVVQKGKPQRSARDVLYQTVVLQDDKGNKMRGTLFGDQILGHVDALVSNGVYEIANAPIKTLPDQYRRDPTELPYTMGFGRQTFIHPLSTPEACLPEYLCVSQVPKTATLYDIFDVIGTLLYVEPVAREVTTKQGRKNTVREIIITDHGTEQPIVVSAWNELSHNDCEQLASLVTSLPVIGFTGLRVSPFRGFSLTGTMSTIIDVQPVGPKVDNLKEWIARSMGFLTDLQARVNKVRDPNTPVPVVKLSYLKNKKAKSTLQDERYQLNVTVPNPELQKVNAYLGCSNCGKRTEYVAGQIFKCETCTKDEVVSEPRITFNCEVSDGTDQLEITTFTADTVALFQMSAADIFHLKHSEDNTTFGKVCDSLRNKPFIIEVSPKTALSRNNTLQWALRQVIACPSQNVSAEKILQPAPESPEPDETAVQSSPSVARKLDFGESVQKASDLTLIEVQVSSDYPSLRKLPSSIAPTTETVPLTAITTEEQTAATQTEAAGTTPSSITLSPKTAQTETTPEPATPNLKAPKIEKKSAVTPETPAQSTPKRTNVKPAAMPPSKKNKGSTSSTATN